MLLAQLSFFLLITMLILSLYLLHTLNLLTYLLVLVIRAILLGKTLNNKIEKFLVSKFNIYEMAIWKIISQTEEEKYVVNWYIFEYFDDSFYLLELNSMEKMSLFSSDLIKDKSPLYLLSSSDILIKGLLPNPRPVSSKQRNCCIYEKSMEPWSGVGSSLQWWPTLIRSW